MNNTPKYIIVAGVNGAGKSTLYQSVNISLDDDIFSGTQRINADEILKSLGGDWRKTKDNGRAMREVIKRLETSFQDKVSINHETTLSGAAKGHIKRINEAKRNGFEVSLVYVGLKSYQTAIERVDMRVSKGGHGVDHELIKKRYFNSLNNLETIIPYVDNLYVYQNDTSLDPIYIKKGNKVVWDHSEDVEWLSNIVNKKESFLYHDKNEKEFDKAKRFLVEDIGIDQELVAVMHKKGFLRQDIRDNLLCIWNDSGKIAGCTEIGTKKNSDWFKVQNNSKGDIGFNIKNGDPKRLFFFQSSLEMLSFMSFNKSNLKDSWFVSTEGTNQNLVNNYIEKTKFEFPNKLQEVHTTTQEVYDEVADLIDRKAVKVSILSENTYNLKVSNELGNTENIFDFDM
ncbi:zeta toxin family protein [Enterococcus casseliflavus]|uniref:zeta toxin family protein n=1 Tax=Enterococcus casseliflavus TaxID=37734 RepID=UPI0035CA70C3